MFTYLEETKHEAGRQSPLPPEVFLLEVGHDMGSLAPEVHGFLQRNMLAPSLKLPP